MKEYKKANDFEHGRFLDDKAKKSFQTHIEKCYGEEDRKEISLQLQQANKSIEEAHQLLKDIVQKENLLANASFDDIFHELKELTVIISDSECKIKARV